MKVCVKGNLIPVFFCLLNNRKILFFKSVKINLLPVPQDIGFFQIIDGFFKTFRPAVMCMISDMNIPDGDAQESKVKEKKDA